MEKKNCLRLSLGLVASMILLGEATSVLAYYSSVVLADHPIHYWRLEETLTSEQAADAGSPGGNPGRYTGGVTLGQTTEPLIIGGTCAAFDGANGSFVDLGLFHPGDSATFEAWVNLATDASTTVKAVIARWDGSYELDTNGVDVGYIVVMNTN